MQRSAAEPEAPTTDCRSPVYRYIRIRVAAWRRRRCHKKLLSALPV